MAIEKLPTPMGPGDSPLGPQGDLFEVEVEVPSDIVVDLNAEPEDPEGPEDFYENLATTMSEEDLRALCMQVESDYDSDLQSNGEWMESFTKGVKLLGLKLEETNDPFEGACTAVHPLLIEAAVDHLSKTSAELLPADGPAKTKIYGPVTKEQLERAERLKDHMNYHLTEEVEEYYDETEKAIMQSALWGSAFKKNYYDAGLGRTVSEYVPVDQLVVPNHATSLSSAERYTHIIYLDEVAFQDRIDSGMYQLTDDVEIQPTVPNYSDLRIKMKAVMGESDGDDEMYTVLEHHCYLEGYDEVEGNKTYLPYIVSVLDGYNTVLSVRRNYSPEDPKGRKKEFFTHYKFLPGFGFMGLGYIHLLGNLSAAATAAMQALLDSGQFANLPAGFKSKGLRVLNDNEPLAPGEWREVETKGQTLKDSLLPVPYKEPSPTLFQLLSFVVETGQRFADKTQKTLENASSYGPVGTTMALLEGSSKFFSAVHKRYHRAQRAELKVIKRLITENIPEGVLKFSLEGAHVEILKSDYEAGVDIVPVSDPNIPSSAHRLMMTQLALDLAQQAPAGMYDIQYLHETILNIAGFPNVELAIPKKPAAQPNDPLTDIQAATVGLPIKAFEGQDHASHIAVKTAFLSNPAHQTQPTMQRIAPILQANIQEHITLDYITKMKGTMATGLAPQQAAEQVMRANAELAKKGGTPEEQMVQLEAQRVANEQDRNQIAAAKNVMDFEVAQKKLKLAEMEAIVKAYTNSASKIMESEEADKDRKVDVAKIVADMLKSDDEMDFEKGKFVIETLMDIVKQKGVDLNGQETE